MFGNVVAVYKQSYSGLSRETWLLSLIMLINRSGTMVVPFLSLYLTSNEMGYTLPQASFVYMMFGAGAFIGAYFGGRLTDKIGFHQVQLITLAGGGLFFIVLSLMKTYVWICVFTFLLSLVNEAFRPANSTAIAAYSTDENRTRSYSLNRLAINLGWAVGGGLGGLIAHFSYALLFWVDGITNLSAAVLLFVILKPRNRKSGHELPKVTLPAPVAAHRDRPYLWFIFCTALFAICFFQLFSNMPVYLKKERLFTEPMIGSLMTLNGLLIVLVEMVLVYRLEQRKTPLRFIMLGTLLVGTSFCILNISYTSYLLAVFMIVVITIGEIFTMPFQNTYWINRSSHQNRGQYAAMFTMAWSLAQTVGPLSGALIAEHYGFATLWWSIGALCVLSSGGILLLKEVAPRPQDADLTQQEHIFEDEAAAATDMMG